LKGWVGAPSGVGRSVDGALMRQLRRVLRECSLRLAQMPGQLPRRWMRRRVRGRWVEGPARPNHPWGDTGRISRSGPIRTPMLQWSIQRRPRRWRVPWWRAIVSPLVGDGW